MDVLLGHNLLNEELNRVIQRAVGGALAIRARVLDNVKCS